MIKYILLLAVLAIWLPNIMITSHDAYSEKPVIIFDKPAYNPFATVKILIVDPASNVDREQKDVVQAVAYTKSNVGNIFEFTEVSPDAGVFQTLVTLTPDQREWPADLVVHKDDYLFVQFSSESGSSVSSTYVDFFTSLVMFDKVQYGLDEKVKIFVLDSEENRLPNARDTVELLVWSTTDVKGLKLTLKEITINSGIFTGTISLTEDLSSSGNRLKVTSSDVITAKYTDKTLPPSAKQDEPEAEVKDLFGAALVGQKKARIELKPPAGPEIVDQFGNPVTDVKLGQVVIIQDNVVNRQNTNQKFAYIVLIKDKDGITVSLSWITGEVPPSSTFKASQSWIPTEVGEYNVAIFLWESINNPVVLAPQKTATITVTHPLD